MSTPFDLHVLSTPPAFILSQDQTLNKMVSKELSFLKSSYWSHPLASKKSVKSLSSHSTRKDFCPFLVLRVSFFTLFNLQGTRRFAAGFYFTTFRGACQALFSTSFEVFIGAWLVCVLRELIYLTRSSSSCQELFSRFSDSLVTLDLVPSDANSFILADSRAFVKHFFQTSEAFPSSSLRFSASRKALS